MEVVIGIIALIIMPVLIIVTFVLFIIFLLVKYGIGLPVITVCWMIVHIFVWIMLFGKGFYFKSTPWEILKKIS